MDYILELNEVSKKYATSDFSLDRVSFVVPSGTIMGFVGENGAGKTTTIGCILNTLHIDSGEIKIFGEKVSDNNKELFEQIGVVYDGDNFPKHLSAEQLADIMCGVYRQWDNALFQKYISHFHLNREQKIKFYSKGMTTKLAIAVALAHHPKLLILDEATSGLDPVMRDEMLDVFLEFVEDETHSILLSSHITSDLEKIADYITFIHNGKIIMTALKDDLIYNYAIIRCKESQFEKIDRADIVAYRRKEHQIDVLVSDIKTANRKYDGYVVDRTSIDEIMLLLVKGETK